MTSAEKADKIASALHLPAGAGHKLHLAAIDMAQQTGAETDDVLTMMATLIVLNYRTERAFKALIPPILDLMKGRGFDAALVFLGESAARLQRTNNGRLPKHRDLGALLKSAASVQKTTVRRESALCH